METVFPARGTLAPSILTPKVSLFVPPPTPAGPSSSAQPCASLFVRLTDARPSSRSLDCSIYFSTFYCILFLYICFLSVMKKLHLFRLVFPCFFFFFFFCEGYRVAGFNCDFKRVRLRWIREQTMVGEVSNIVLDLLGNS